MSAVRVSDGVPRNARAVMAARVPTDDDVDLFLTPPWGGRTGGEIILEIDPAARSVWEPACGPGAMAHGLADYFPIVHTSDAYLYDGNVIHDFIGDAPSPYVADWIVSNPPFATAEMFIRRAYAEARRGVAMLLRTGMLEGQGRHGLHYGDCPLTVIAPFSERLPMLKGRYDPDASSAAFYSWFIWVKPVLRPRRFMSRWPDGTWRPSVRDIAPGARQRLFRASDMQFAMVADDANAVRESAA